MSLQIAAWEAKDGEKKPLPKKQVTSLLVSKLLFYSLLLSFFMMQLISEKALRATVQ